MSFAEVLATGFLGFLGVSTGLYPFIKVYQRRAAERYFQTYLSNISSEPLREVVSGQFTNPVTTRSIVTSAVVAVLYVASFITLVVGANGG